MKTVQLLNATKRFKIGSLNTQTLQKVYKIPELIASAELTGQDIICIQENRFIHEDTVIKEHTYDKWKLLTLSAWKNSINAATGGIGMLLSSQAYNTIASVEMISPRIMIVHFQGNPQTSVISCYSPTNISDEQETEIFYTKLTCLTRQIPKHNVLIIGVDLNAHLGKDSGYKYAYHQTTNRNGQMLKDYLQENNMLCLNTHFQKRHGQLWTHNSPNDFKSQIDFIIINKKWKNSVKNCRAYNSFNIISSDHRIITTDIKLSLRANTKKNSKCKPYDWTRLSHDTEIRNAFIITVKNRFLSLQNSDAETTLSASTRYTYFEKSCKDAANKVIPLKPKLKKRIPWETEKICQKLDILHKAAQLKGSSPIQMNINKFINAQESLVNSYDLEQQNYINKKIYEIQMAATNKKSALAWQTIN